MKIRLEFNIFQVGVSVVVAALCHLGGQGGEHREVSSQAEEEQPRPEQVPPLGLREHCVRRRCRCLKKKRTTKKHAQTQEYCVHR